MGEKTVLIGGTGSGKSAFALEIARSSPNFSQPVFIATATAFDDEMREKIKRHKTERGDDFKTVEAPVFLASALGIFAADERRLAIVDCLTVWLCNLCEKMPSAAAREQREKFIGVFEKFRGQLVTVTNETGMGIVPPEKNTRSYSADLSALNRRIVSLCDKAYLLVAGAPIKIK